MNWINEVKPTVIQNLRKANVSGKAAMAILTFERRKTTVRNKIARGRSFESLYENGEMDLLSDALNELNWIDLETNLHPQYWAEWVTYCKILNILPKATIGDHLS